MSVFDVLNEHIRDSAISKRAMQADRLIVSVTEDLLTAMAHQDVSKTELARRLGKSKSFVTSTLDGSRNMTLRTLSRIAYALGLQVRVRFEALDNGRYRRKNIIFVNFSEDIGDIATSNAGTNVRMTQ